MEGVHAFRHDAVTLPPYKQEINAISHQKSQRIVGHDGTRLDVGADYASAVQGIALWHEIYNHRAHVRLSQTTRVDAIIADRLLVDSHLKYLAGKRSIR